MCSSCEMGILSLSDIVASGNTERVKSFLANHDNVDITYDEGKLLRLAIEGDGNVEITKLLLQYFEEKQLPKFEAGSSEYNILKYHLKTNLETAVEDEHLTEEMKGVLSKYIDLSASDVAVETDLGDDDVIDGGVAVELPKDPRSVISERIGCNIRLLDGICDDDLPVLVQVIQQGGLGDLILRFLMLHDSNSKLENEMYSQHEAVATISGLHNDHSPSPEICV